MWLGLAIATINTRLYKPRYKHVCKWNMKCFIGGSRILLFIGLLFLKIEKKYLICPYDSSYDGTFTSKLNWPTPSTASNRIEVLTGTNKYKERRRRLWHNRLTYYWVLVMTENKFTLNFQKLYITSVAYFMTSMTVLRKYPKQMHNRKVLMVVRARFVLWLW